jgi:hypothetical protein
MLNKFTGVFDNPLGTVHFPGIRVGLGAQYSTAAFTVAITHQNPGARGVQRFHFFQPITLPIFETA